MIKNDTDGLGYKKTSAECKVQSFFAARLNTYIAVLKTGSYEICQTSNYTWFKNCC